MFRVRFYFGCNSCTNFMSNVIHLSIARYTHFSLSGTLFTALRAIGEKSRYCRDGNSADIFTLVIIVDIYWCPCSSKCFNSLNSCLHRNGNSPSPQPLHRNGMIPRHCPFVFDFHAEAGGVGWDYVAVFGHGHAGHGVDFLQRDAGAEPIQNSAIGDSGIAKAKCWP